MKIPQTKPLIIPMPKEHNYRIEEGKYRVRIYKLVKTPKQNGLGCVEVLRIVFELNVPGKEQFLNLAKAEFPLTLEHGSELRNVITRLLSKGVLAALSGREIDLEILLGRAADVEIEHIITSKRENYDYPFVQIRDIQLPGTFVKLDEPTQPKEADPKK